MTAMGSLPLPGSGLSGKAREARSDSPPGRMGAADLFQPMPVMLTTPAECDAGSRLSRLARSSFSARWCVTTGSESLSPR